MIYSIILKKNRCWSKLSKPVRYQNLNFRIDFEFFFDLLVNCEEHRYKSFEQNYFTY